MDKTYVHWYRHRHFCSLQKVTHLSSVFSKMFEKMSFKKITSFFLAIRTLYLYLVQYLFIKIDNWISGDVLEKDHYKFNEMLIKLL